MEDDYELCIKVENDARLNYIPKEFFLGLSAATGGLSDDHDVDQFLTYSVQTSEEKAIKVGGWEGGREGGRGGEGRGGEGRGGEGRGGEEVWWVGVEDCHPSPSSILATAFSSLG